MKKSSTFFFTAGVLLFALAILKYIDASDGEDKSIATGLELNSNIRATFDTLLLQTQHNTEVLASEFEQGSMMPEDLNYLVEIAAAADPNVHEIILGFEPFQFDSDLELFGRKYAAHEEEFVDLLQLYNYRDTLETRAIWYNQTRIYLSPFWSAPYLTETNVVLIDLTWPIYWRVGGAGNQFLGAVRYTVNLNKTITEAIGKTSEEQAVLSLCDEYGQNVFSEKINNHFGIGSAEEDLSSLSTEQQLMFQQNEQSWVLLNEGENKASKHLFYATSGVQNWRYMIGYDASSWQKLQAGALMKYLYLFTGIIMMVVGFVARSKEDTSN